MRKRETIVILDFGSQYSQLIARRVREAEVYCELIPYHAPAKEVTRLNPAGYILSGGPASVYTPDAPHLPDYVLESGRPVLGICYGMQLLAYHLGGQVDPAPEREYGPAEVELTDVNNLLSANSKYQIPNTKSLISNHQPLSVWMSHGDRIDRLPTGFQALARSENSPVAAMGDPARGLYGLQFHPEVVHTPRGPEILRAFLYDVCGCQGGWTPGNFIDQAIHHIQAQVGAGRVVCGLSGGVDSAVTAALLHRAIGDGLTCIFVNNGLMRLGEPEQVVSTFRDHMHMRLIAVDATEGFLSDLEGVTDPEVKRKRIGERFIRVFEAEARRLGQIDWLAQGTLYPT